METVFFIFFFYIALVVTLEIKRSLLKYRNYAIRSRTMFSKFSLFVATIFQDLLSFKGY